MAGRRSGTLDIIEQRRRNGSKYRSLRDKGGKGPTELRSRGGPATLDKCMMGNIQGPGPHHGTGQGMMLMRARGGVNAGAISPPSVVCPVGVRW